MSMSMLGVGDSPYRELISRAVRTDGQLNEHEQPYLGMRLFKQVSDESILELEITEVFGGGQFMARVVGAIDLSKSGSC